MKIRLRHILGFVLAVAAAIGFDYLIQHAMERSFENPDPLYWTSYLFYLRVFLLFGISTIIGCTFERRAWLFGALAALIFFGYSACSEFFTNFRQGHPVPVGYWQEEFLAGLIYITFNALMAALVGRVRFRLYPRSRFGTVKLRLILVFFALILVGCNLFIRGMHGLYNEYRLSTAGLPGKVTEMFAAWPSTLDEVIFNTVDGKRCTVKMPGSLERRGRFDRGEEMFIRYVPGFDRDGMFINLVPGDADVFRWAEEDNTPSILSHSGIAFLGLVSAGLGMLFWRRVRSRTMPQGTMMEPQ